MCDKELLASYLYDELGSEERRVLQQHLASCRECREESQRLRALRTQLGAWTVPERPLDLRIAPPAAAASRFRVSRGWGLAAAAALLLAVGSALGGVEAQMAEGGLTIRAGWGTPAQPQAIAQAATREELEALQQQIRGLEAALAAAAERQSPVVPVSTAVPAASDAEITRRLTRMIRESEDRQQQVLATRLVQGIRELQAAHSSDLTRLERALNQQQGIWNDEMLRQREEIKQVYRVVSQQQMQR